MVYCPNIENLSEITNPMKKAEPLAEPGFPIMKTTKLFLHRSGSSRLLPKLPPKVVCQRGCHKQGRISTGRNTYQQSKYKGFDGGAAENKDSNQHNQGGQRSTERTAQS